MENSTYAGRLVCCYFIFFFIGFMGMHRIYLGHYVYGLIWFLAIYATGMIMLIPFMMLFDLFAIPFLCKAAPAAEPS